LNQAGHDFTFCELIAANCIYSWNFSSLADQKLNRGSLFPQTGYIFNEAAMHTAHTVAQILKSKEIKAVYSIAPDTSVLDAIGVMADKNIGALLVMDEKQIIGIISERDYARKIVLMGRSSKETQVRDIMSSAVMYVRPEHTNQQCMALMTENRLRHLPVMRGEQLVGMISIGDLVKDIISEQQFIIEQLEYYITGERVWGVASHGQAG
jgi:CBS domain-containing protein